MLCTRSSIEGRFVEGAKRDVSRSEESTAFLNWIRRRLYSSTEGVLVLQKHSHRPSISPISFQIVARPLGGGVGARENGSSGA